MKNENDLFDFQHFSLHHGKSTLKIGTDSVLLASLVPIDGVTNVLDIGCGCGVIGFCIADRIADQSSENVEVTGIDIDADSIDEARLNASNFPHQEQISFLFEKIDLQHFNLKKEQKKFSLIVSNPPYFDSSLKPENVKNLRSKHRDDNLSFDELVENAVRLLADDGHFYVILPTSEAIDFESIAKKKLHLCEKTAIRPVPDKPVNRFILGFSKQIPINIKEQELLIRDENRNYSREYRNITLSFYTKLK